MKKLFILLFISAILSCISSNVFAQTTGTGSNVILDTYTITITNKSGETVLNSPTNGLNISVIPGSNTTTLVKGVTFMANGAIQLLTDVNPANNIISVVWDGSLTDGKITITGMFSGGIASDSFLVKKIEQSGGADITNKINVNIILSSSQPSPLTNKDDEENNDIDEEDTIFDEEEDSDDEEFNEPEITLSGPQTIQLTDRKSIINKFEVEGINFISPARCFVDLSDKSMLKIKPKRFVLTPDRADKTILTKVTNKALKKVLKGNQAEPITIDIDCENGAFDSFDILISP